MSPQPYGTWSAPLSAGDLAAGSIRIATLAIDRGVLHWVERRPDEGGRQRLCVAGPAGPPRDLSPPDHDVRSRVHEYGGGEFAVRAGRCVWVDDASGGLFEAVGDGAPRAWFRGTPGHRHADLAISPDGRWVVAVEEVLSPPDEPLNRLVAIPIAGGESRVVDASADFVASPCFAPDGRRLAYLAWNHPCMPWDGTELRETGFGPEGPRGAPRRVAGSERESICQPSYAPDGRLVFVSDRSGYWNLWVRGDSGAIPLARCEAEVGRPLWALGQSTYGFLDEHTLVACFRERCVDRVGRIDLGTGRVETLELPWTAVGALVAEAGEVGLVASSPSTPASVFRFRPAERRLALVRASTSLGFDDGFLSRPEAIEVERDGARVHAFFHPPAHPQAEPPDGERPPLIVFVHGGPTGASELALDLGILFWTQRGFAVADVNYGGSTGFGRAYRERLDGAWGVVDVDDCIAVARSLSQEGRVDPERLAIRGGSAGGFTVLSALTFRDVFHAGISRYGIADLELLEHETHKFEARYLHRLIGPYPAARERYRARSPIHHVERLATPVLLLQGTDDPVVPMSQADAMSDALARRSVPHAYLRFEGEGHGFRRAETLVRAFEAELWFHARTFGFDAAVPEPGDEWVR